MKRSKFLVLSATALLLFGSVLTTSAQGYAKYHRTFYEGVDWFELAYFPGGVTAKEAKARTGGYMALPAGYYGYMRIGSVWRNDIVGYTMIKGQTLANYLKSYGRPILAIRDRTVVEIFGSYRSFLAANPARYQYARELDYVARDKNCPTGRLVLAKRGAETHIFVMDGRDKDCRNRLKRNRLGSKFVFSDGGVSLWPKTLNPCYLIVHHGGLTAILFG